MFERFHFKAHKKFDASIGLMEFFLTAISRQIAPNIGNHLFDFQGSLFQSKGIILKTCKIELV